MTQYRCPECGEPTWPNQSEEPDGRPDSGPLVDAPARRGMDPTGWRVMQFERLGFSYAQACELGNTRDARGFWLYWADVEPVMRAAVAKHGVERARELVFDIYSAHVSSA